MAALSASHAYADLYRWIDRESGSIKYSNTPPPWFGDPEKQRGAPAVEVIRERAPAAPPKPAAPPEGAVAALEVRWVELVKAIAALPPTTDFSHGGVRQQLEAYQALAAELERLDPAGAPRRLAVEAAIFEAARRGQ